MQDPEPPIKFWQRPSRSIVSASALGGAIAIILVESIKHYLHVDIDVAFQGAVTVVCTFIAGYLTPD